MVPGENFKEGGSGKCVNVAYPIEQLVPLRFGLLVAFITHQYFHNLSDVELNDGLQLGEITNLHQVDGIVDAEGTSSTW